MEETGDKVESKKREKKIDKKRLKQGRYTSQHQPHTHTHTHSHAHTLAHSHTHTHRYTHTHEKKYKNEKNLTVFVTENYNKSIVEVKCYFSSKKDNSFMFPSIF